MIKINWSEVEATKQQLLRGGASDASEMLVIVLYYSKSECDRIQITLDQLEQSLFDIESNFDVKSVYLYDIEMKQPYLRCEEPDRVSSLESVPNSGHPNVLVEFGGMSPEARDVWIEITTASAQHYIGQGV